MAEPITAKTLESKSVKELFVLKGQLKKELFDTKMKHAMRGLKETHFISVLKKNIARVSTYLVLKAKQYGNSGR